MMLSAIRLRLREGRVIPNDCTGRVYSSKTFNLFIDGSMNAITGWEALDRSV